MVNIIEPHIELLDPIYKYKILMKIANTSKVCYKTNKIYTPQTASDFVRFLMKEDKSIDKRKHWVPIEHAGVFSVKLYCSRGCSHEAVRYRLISALQESTRFCDYSADRFNKEITVILPEDLTQEEYDIWYDSVCHDEKSYFKLREIGAPPEKARAVLPISTKTELVITTNLREWYHIFEERCSKKAHPEIRKLILQIYRIFNDALPEIFGDLGYE